MERGRQRNAVVAGGSVGGLFAAVALRRLGWKVDVFERVAEGLDGRGAGIAGHDELSQILRDIGIIADRPGGIDVSRRVALDRFGGELARFHRPQYLTSWNLIFSLLRASVPDTSYHAGIRVAAVEQEGEAAVAVLSSGERIAADLVIGADGIRSGLRAALAPLVVPEYSGYVAWRGVIAEAALSPRFMEEVFGNYTFCFPPGGQFIGYPLAGPDGSIAPGRRRYNFLWYRHTPRGAALDRALTDETGVVHEHSVPPPLIRRANIAALHADAGRDLPPLLAEIVRGAEQYLIQPIYDVESAHIGFGRVALVGDAAFVCRPHVGIGVLKAAQDAAALAECLAGEPDVPAAVAAYEERRLQPNLEAVAFGRHLGAFIERGLDSPLSDPSLALSYDYILRESARLPRPRPEAGSLQ